VLVGLVGVGVASIRKLRPRAGVLCFWGLWCCGLLVGGSHLDRAVGPHHPWPLADSMTLRHRVFDLLIATLNEVPHSALTEPAIGSKSMPMPTPSATAAGGGAASGGARPTPPPRPPTHGAPRLFVFVYSWLGDFVCVVWFFFFPTSLQTPL